jgi:hypothetical protein
LKKKQIVWDILASTNCNVFQSNKKKRIIPSALILEIKIMDPQKLPPCKKWLEICSIVEQV